ncbi:hypothetical protein LSH36_253g04137 [Paralvinella palmiformis]|uniref:Uncharacterized protein n=1 Tax=Paralvinella palmiformis TaxID=53620 RepID=A0AAD9JMU2_9ANNE|nr:hypothetical protein LSH36_253g04137 [Paralvinella palmiformis]
MVTLNPGVCGHIPNVPFSVRVPSSITDPTRSSVQELSLHTTRNVFFLFRLLLTTLTSISVGFPNN